jgi:3-oxoacyl-[acyl-carrier-protein] synthase II
MGDARPSSEATADGGRRRVVVTGLGVLSGPCVGHEELWAALVAPDPSGTHRRIVGFDARQWLDRRRVRRTGLFAQIAVAAARLAHDDAGAPTGDDPERTAVVMGVGAGNPGTAFDNQLAFEQRGREGVDLLTGVLTMVNAGSANIAFDLGTKGPTFSMASGCASGTHAVGEGFHLLRDGRADVAYVGGSEAALLDDDVDADFMAAGLLNLRVHTEEAVGRPFDRDRQGFVFADGAAVLRLETLEGARARGAHIYAELLGGANTVDAHDMIQPAPRGEGLRRCMAVALAQSGVELAAVGQINAHGTGTLHNDQAEVEAAIDLFGPNPPPITGTKGVTGHPGAASGAMEALITALSIERRLIPPVAHTVVPDPALAVDIVRGEPRPWTPGVAISNSLGLGGQNGSVVLGPAPG